MQQHHHHRRAAQVASDLAQVPTLSARDLPQLPTPAMPTLAQTPEPSAIALAIPNSGDALKNPLIHNSSLPTDLVFIVFGAVLGLIFVGFVGYRTVMAIISNVRAKRDREVYLSTPGLALFGTGTYTSPSSSNSSFWEKNSGSTASSNSLYPLSQSAKDGSITGDSSAPGRAYRNAHQGDSGRRNSMFVSPVLDIMNNRKSQSNLELPLFHRNDAASLYSGMNSSLGSLFLSGSPNADFPEGFGERQYSKARGSRPPSQLLDDLINEKSIE